MIKTLETLHWGWKMAGSFIAGVATVYAAVVGPVRSDIRELSDRIAVVERKVEPVYCLAKAQIHGTDPLQCLVSNQ